MTPAPVSGRRPTKDELEQFRGAEVDDLLPDRIRLLFIGINPGLWTAAVNAHFARPGNRFWPAMHRAGITATEVDASRGLPEEARRELLDAGIGISNICPVATARADELSTSDLRAGGERLRTFVRERRPDVVAVLGVTAWRQAFGDRSVRLGPVAAGFEGARLWILPNPSGLNAHESVDSLAAKLREAAADAGVPLHPPSSGS